MPTTNIWDAHDHIEVFELIFCWEISFWNKYLEANSTQPCNAK